MADISEFNINSTSYNLKDTQARDDVNSLSTDLKTNYLPLSGGIMTGDIESASSYIINNQTDPTTIPSSNIYGGALSFHDKNTDETSSVYSHQDTNGTMWLMNQVVRDVDGLIYNQFGIGIDSNGNAVISVRNPAAWCSAIGALPLSGGTVTGEIIANEAGFFAKNSEMDTSANTQSSSRYSAYAGVKDVNNRFLAYHQAIQDTNGRVGTQIAARKYINNESVDNSLYLFVNNDGSKTVVISDQAAWLSALGTSKITYGTGGLTGGSSSLATGTVYLQYE